MLLYPFEKNVDTMKIRKVNYKQTTVKKTLLYVIASVMICLTVIILGNFMGGSPEALAENKVSGSDKFPVINPVIRDTTYAVEYVADIQAIQHIELRSRVDGYIEKINVDEGQFVKKGVTLFNISSQEYEAELSRAKAVLNSAIAEVKAAEVEWRSTKELVDKNIVSQMELDLAQAKLEAQRAKVEEARSEQSAAALNLSYTKIKAPFDGTIGRIPNRIGSLLEEGTLLTTFSDNSRVYAYFHVSENEYLNLMNNGDKTNEQTVSLVLANHQIYPYHGKIEAVDSRMDRETGNITFRTSFSNKDLLLKHGSTGKVRIEKEVKDALIIPQIATIESQDKMFVYIVDSENVVNRQAVITKLRLPHLYIIESGLKASDRIVYKGLQLIHEGEKIEPQLTYFMQGQSPRQLVLNDQK